MKQSNEGLPQQINELLGHMQSGQAVPLSDVDGVPYVAVKISPETVEELLENEVRCEMKPSFMNINFNGEVVALVFIQLRLNEDDSLIYTLTYDINEDKHLKDCYSILNMLNYGLLIATDNEHDFIQLDVNFVAEFDPRKILEYTLEKATDYKKEDFNQVLYAFTSQVVGSHKLWEMLADVAPFEKQWYAAMDMNTEAQ